MVTHYSRIFRFSVVLIAVGLGALCAPFSTAAQQPTVTIVSLTGQTMVFFQGGAPIPASVDTVLRAEDAIRTHAGATVVLKLSDGSELIVGENTNLHISVLTEDFRTGARTSRLKLLWGKVRALIAPGHQAEGSSFGVDTPNTLVGMKFSQPDSEVVYDPGTSTTSVIPHKFDVVVTNRVTNESVRIPEGYIGIIKDRGIQKVARTIPFPTGQADIVPIAQFRLDTIAGVLREFPDQIIVLEGHSDSVGSEKKNRELAQERVDQVKTHLVQNYGFDQDRIKTFSYGSSRPIMPNDTASGRARNRRVTVSRQL